MQFSAENLPNQVFSSTDKITVKNIRTYCERVRALRTYNHFHEHRSFDAKVEYTLTNFMELVSAMMQIPQLIGLGYTQDKLKVLA